MPLPVRSSSELSASVLLVGIEMGPGGRERYRVYSREKSYTSVTRGKKDEQREPASKYVSIRGAQDAAPGWSSLIYRSLPLPFSLLLLPHSSLVLPGQGG